MGHAHFPWDTAGGRRQPCTGGTVDNVDAALGVVVVVVCDVVPVDNVVNTAVVLEVVPDDDVVDLDVVDTNVVVWDVVPDAEVVDADVAAAVVLLLSG